MNETWSSAPGERCSRGLDPFILVAMMTSHAMKTRDVFGLVLLLSWVQVSVAVAQVPHTAGYAGPFNDE